ncbi:MAG: hypothetical protein IJU50_05480 [Lachnospiraceae bacterium]|nr:hypothetical protein [Lachnospiraceae bacterium]
MSQKHHRHLNAVLAVLLCIALLPLNALAEGVSGAAQTVSGAVQTASGAVQTTSGTVQIASKERPEEMSVSFKDSKAGASETNLYEGFAEYLSQTL